MFGYDCRFARMIARFFTLISILITTACGGGGGSGGGGGGSASVNPFAYPTAEDKYESGVGDNTAANAVMMVLGTREIRTLWPLGDSDWVKIDLVMGTDYEFSASRLCATCDTRIYLYDTDGMTQLAFNDDWVGYDSAVQFTPTATGTYYIQVIPFEAVYGVATYTLTLDELIDGDGDGFSIYHDCNDADVSIYPLQTEIEGDGIDQNCAGVDALDRTMADSNENDNTGMSAVPLRLANGLPWEFIWREQSFAANTRSLHQAGDIDYFSFNVPANSGFEVAIPLTAVGTPLGQIDARLYDSDMITELDSVLGSTQPSLIILNSEAAQKTYYLSVNASDGISQVRYTPMLYSIGKDADQDGYYDQDWGSLRDCNDADAMIHLNSIETIGDMVDSNCNGQDDS